MICLIWNSFSFKLSYIWLKIFIKVLSKCGNKIDDKNSNDFLLLRFIL